MDLRPWMRPRFLAVPAILLFLMLYAVGAFDGRASGVRAPLELDVTSGESAAPEPDPALR